MADLLIDEKLTHLEGKAIRQNIRENGGKIVHITVPASVAFNIKDMNKVTEKVLGRLGCPGCHSGYDLRFDFETKFAVDDKLNFIGGL